MITYEENVLLVVETCIKCGTPFGIESNLNRNLQRTGDTFYCPNGHAQIYAEPVEKKLRALEKQVKALQADKAFYKDEAEYKARQLSATKGVLTRTKNRIAKGICPCCNRQFVNMQRHMENKHPNYLETSNA